MCVGPHLRGGVSVVIAIALPYCRAEDVGQTGDKREGEMLAQTSETEQQVIVAVALPSCCQAEDIKDEEYMLTRTCESNNYRHCTTIVLSAKRAGGASGPGFRP